MLEATNIDGRKVCGDNLNEINEAIFEAYIVIILLSGAYESHSEATKNLCNKETGRPIFSASMSQKNIICISGNFISMTSRLAEDEITNSQLYKKFGKRGYKYIQKYSITSVRM